MVVNSRLKDKKNIRKEAIREAYGLALLELGKVMPETVVLDADVSKSTRTVHFAKVFPERFINFGIAEQNMMCAAAGMATEGLIPFVNSFSFLTTYRAADQFRTSIVYPGLNVKIGANYGGLSDSYDGPTHQTVADIAWVRALPNLTVIVPSDAIEIKKAIPLIAKHNGPVWIRLCRAETEIIHSDNYDFKIGRAEIIRHGKDIALIGCGIAVPRIIKAAEQLTEKGYDPMLVSISTIKPIDEDIIIKAAKITGAIITCEEHNVSGGLGAAVSEVVAEEFPVRVKKMGIPDTFAESGDYEKLLDKYGLAVNAIAENAEKMIKEKNLTKLISF